ncbi:MAG: hypothetical protein WCT77_06295 [Bacteroidota bacterium]
MKKLIFLIVFIGAFAQSFAADDILKNIMPSKDVEYSIRLKNGDVITGFVVENVQDPEEGAGIKFKTAIGSALVFANQIVEIMPTALTNRHNHRVFLLPTANPISGNHFIGFFEIGFLYAGIGISDILSVTAGRSFIPGIASRQQVSVIDGKVSLGSVEFESVARKVSFALGGNMTFLNHNNRLVHFYGVTTVEMSRSELSGMVFYKGGSQDSYILNFAQNALLMNYEDGAFGIGLGLDTKLPFRQDLHVIGEIWNSNVVKPTDSGVLLGLRLCNTNFSADFGFTVLTTPLFIPFASFVWTPF